MCILTSYFNNSMVSSPYFFLFFGLPPIFSYFFMKFLFFRVLLGTQKHFEILEIKLPIKLINSTKNGNFLSKKTSLKPLQVIFFRNSCPDFLNAFGSMQGILGLFGCCCSKDVVGFYCKEDIHLVTVNFDIVSVCPKNYCCLSFSLF